LLINIKAEDKNVSIFVFTIVTVVFLPLSFVTSYFGMNTSDVRDMEQGQWLFWVIGISLTITVLLVVWVITLRGQKWKTARQNDKLLHLESCKWE
jgi:Mg2+ and Co2+ transporter CorA